MKADRAYQWLPIPLQNLACSVYGYHLIRRRYGQGYQRVEDEVFSREHWAPERVKELSAGRLREVIRYAARSVPYYRSLFASLKLDPRDIRDPQALRLLPVLKKSTVQERISEFRSDQWSSMRCTTAHTSGTTGSGLVFPLTLEAERGQWAIWWRYRARFGISRRTWYAHFYGKSIVPLRQTQPPFWRINWPGRQILFSGYHLADQYLPYYIDELNRRRPPWIQGYPSLLALVADYILRTGSTLTYRPRIVTIGAETLLEHQKAIIEKAFGAPCRQHYGLTEGVANMSECPFGRLHVDEDFACVEFEPAGESLSQVVGTGYSNLAFPLIRYDTGDVAELDSGHNGSCPCGRPGRLVRRIDGRIEDYIVTPDGRRLGRLDHVFKDMLNVRECQIYQDREDRVVFRVVRGVNYTAEDERAIRHEARSRLGDGVAVDFAYVSELERTPRRKLRFVISELAKGKIDRPNLASTCCN